MNLNHINQPKMLALGGFLILLVAVGCGSNNAVNSPVNSATSDSLASANSAKASSQPATLNRMLESNYQVGFRQTSSWSGGYVGELTLTYTGSTPISGWNLSFDLPGAQLTSVWNARTLGQSGTRFTLQNESYNAVLNPGQSLVVGFVASFSGPASPPGSFGLQDLTPSAPAQSGNESPVVGVFSKDNDWGSGFVGGITLTNGGSTVLTDWSLSFQSNVSLDSAWNGILVSQSGGQVRIDAASYNRRLEPGQQLRIGFQGHPGNPQISNIVVSGAATSSPTSTPTATPSITPTPSPTSTNAPVSAGFLHTQGGQILDSDNHPLVLRGVNWFGLETNTYCPHGLWARSMDSMLDQMVSLGFNCIRLPYSNDIFKASSLPNGIDFSQNADLKSLSPLQIMDKVVEKAGARGMKVILDRHRPDSAGQSALWYTAGCSEAQWIQHWEQLALRYKNNPTVIGMDLHNEPHSPASWGSGDSSTDWRLAAEKAGNRILAINPNLLIVVEGVDQAGGSNYWWGGHLKAAASAPVRLNTAGRLVYETHDYPATVFNQSWFSDPSYPNNLVGLWDLTWGFLAKNQTAPVLVGEFGTTYQTDSDKKWLGTLVDYIRVNGLSYSYWSWNPNSGDTGGILKDDWRTVDSAKVQALQPILKP
ncbi:cellulase family glycosylhydrolase [bacterium]|nr:cellulase family glycosylhydrolase [bacterium]